MDTGREAVQNEFQSTFKRGCLMILLVILGVWAGFAALQWGYTETEYLLWVTFAAGTGFLIGMGLISGGFGRISKRRLFAPGNLSQPPRADGKAVVEGQIQAIKAPLQAPFSNTDCVAYEYKIFERVRTTSGTGSDRRTSTSEVSHYTGTHLRPARIRTLWGDVRILAMPDLDKLRSDIGSSEAGNAFIKRTLFEKREGKLSNIGAMLDDLADVLSDDDGTVEKDWCHREPGESTVLHFKETILPTGVQVVAVGQYDALKRAFVPHPTNLLTIEMGTAAENRPGVGSILASFLFGLGFMAFTLAFALAPRLPTAMIEPLPWSEQAIEYRVDQVMRALGKHDGDTVQRFAELGIPPEHATSVLFQVHDDAMQLILIRAGIPPDTPDLNGAPLILDTDTPELTQALIDRGADPNIVGPWGKTPLINALMSQRVEIAHILLDGGADPFASDQQDQTPIMVANRAGIDDEDLLRRLRYE